MRQKSERWGQVRTKPRRDRWNAARLGCRYDCLECSRCAIGAVCMQFVCFSKKRNLVWTERATRGADDLWGVAKGKKLKQRYGPGGVVAG